MRQFFPPKINRLKTNIIYTDDLNINICKPERILNNSKF